MYRYLPEFAKALLISRRQRALDVRGWDNFEDRLGGEIDSLAIVANAGYLADLEQGSRIDAHSLVLRLNNFQTRGFERAVGTRCDIFLTNFFKDIAFGRPELAAVSHLVSSVPNNLRKSRRSFLYHRHAEHICAGMERLGRREVHVPSLHDFRDACARCSGVPSTGFMAIEFALRHLRCRSIFVTGFSFFRGREHYFEGPLSPRLRHNFNRERIILARTLRPLIAEGRVQVDALMGADLAEAAS